jgi:Tol biopolymer transport system component
VGKISSVNSYPNPTNGEYTVEFTSTKGFNADVYITDLNGRMVRKVTTMNVISGDNLVNVNLSDLNSGLYFFHIQGGNNQIVYQVVVNK